MFAALANDDVKAPADLALIDAVRSMLISDSSHDLSLIFSYARVLITGVHFQRFIWTHGPAATAADVQVYDTCPF